MFFILCFFFFQAEDGIRDDLVTGVQTCALPILKKKTRRDGARASATSSQRRPTKRTSARLCARAFQDPQTRRKIEGSASQRSEERRVGKECRSRWSP